MNVLLDDYLSGDALRALIERARAEDLGPDQLDLTSLYFVAARREAAGLIRSRQAGRLAGGAILGAMAQVYGGAVAVQVMLQDGAAVSEGAAVARLAGGARDVLAMERVALNFLSHLSGIATLTSKYVEAVAGTGVEIRDTRKTIPGLRALAKYAVACGGGVNHRRGLYDAVLVKDNHVAGISIDELAKVLADAIEQVKRSGRPVGFVEVEVDSLEQLEAVLGCGPDMVLLDNMTPEELREAVRMRDERAAVKLEASGNISLATVRAVAETGVDIISVGALTHSVRALDLGLDVG